MSGANPKDRAPARPLTAGTETKQSQPGEAETPTAHPTQAGATGERKMIMEKLLYSPTEAAAHLSIGRSKIYELMRLGELRSVKIGGSRRIPRAALAEFVSRLEAAA